MRLSTKGRYAVMAMADLARREGDAARAVALADIAARCNRNATAARKVEREMAKRIAAVAMSHRIGDAFEAIVTGVSDKGTFVRTLAPHVEGMLVRGYAGVDVGDRIRVTLTAADVERGFIDFAAQ